MSKISNDILKIKSNECVSLLFGIKVKFIPMDINWNWLDNDFFGGILFLRRASGIFVSGMSYDYSNHSFASVLAKNYWSTTMGTHKTKCQPLFPSFLVHCLGNIIHFFIVLNFARPILCCLQNHCLDFISKIKTLLVCYILLNWNISQTEAINFSHINEQYSSSSKFLRIIFAIHSQNHKNTKKHWCCLYSEDYCQNSFLLQST